MSIIYYLHYHPTDDFKHTVRINSDTPIPYDLAQNGYFSDRIYHSRNSKARFYIVTFGYEKGWPRKTPPRTVNRYTLHFIFDGKGKINGTPIKKGDIFIIEPNVQHEIFHDERTPMTLGWIALSGQELELMLEILHFSKKFYFTLDDTQLDTIEKIFIETVYNTPQGRELPFYLFSKFFEVISICKMPYDHEINTTNVYIDHALSYINTYYSHNITVNDIATFLHISVSRLRNVFAQELGYSPQEAIIKKRMAVAKSILSAETVPPMYTVASMCGYTDQGAFSKRFKKEYHVSPSEYVEQLKKQKS